MAKDSRAIAIPAKMILPDVLTRVKQANPLAGTWVLGLCASLLETVAPKTAPTQVWQAIGAAASWGNDVVYGELMAG